MALLEQLTNWLRGGSAPAPAERPRSAVAIVDGQPLTDDHPAVRAVAEQLRQRELAAGGWAAEAGGVTLESYLPEARRLVQQIALGGADGGPPAP
ncbi:MAG: hypothetical protein IT306_22510 [Chloroflexi bacterium]|nr:hypothetical protein [Chloroflexota bacterium]